MNDNIALAFLERSQQQVDQARSRIDHCLGQLQDEDIWWTPREGINSIGIIIQHLMGNLRQWALSGIGGEPDRRDRPSEFRIARQTPKGELQSAFSDLLERVKDVYSQVGNAELLEARRIQGFDTTALSAIYTAMC